MKIEKKNMLITNLEEWEKLAPPKSPERQWEDGRSAKETARAWLSGIPNEIELLMSSHPDFQSVTFDVAEPEKKIPFDNHRSPREADLVILAHDELGEIAITLEAKADEVFDSSVLTKISNALETRIEKPKSKALARIYDLSVSLFNKKLKHEAKITDLRYQLMTAVAGTLAFSVKHEINRAVLIVHEFVTDKTSQHKLEKNAEALTKFYNRIAHQTIPRFEPGILYGPISIPGEPLFEANSKFYIGKAVRYLSNPKP